MNYYTYPDYMAYEPTFRYNSNESNDIAFNNFTLLQTPGSARFNTCLSKDGKYYIEIFGVGSSYRSGRPSVNDGIVPIPERRGEENAVVTYNTDSQTVSAQFTTSGNKYGYAWGINIREKRSVNDSDSGLSGGTIYLPLLARTGFHPNYQNDIFKTGPAPIATNGIQIVKYDSSNRPSVIAVTCFYDESLPLSGESSRLVTIEGVESPSCVKFYSIDWSGDNGIGNDSSETTIPLLNALDIDVVETYEYQASSGGTIDKYSMEPSKIIPDTKNHIVYLIYNGDSPGADHRADAYESSIKPRIVAVDISDISNPIEAARYDFPNINPIRNVDYNEDLSLLALCLRNDSNQNFDTIKILYYDKSSKSFSVRNTYTESSDLDYSGLNFGPKNFNTGHSYLYASNINSLNGSNQEANRSNVGVHILRTSDNFQTISKIKCYQTDSHWNDSADIPISEADIGYISQPQYAPIFSKYLSNNLLYVVYNKYINPRSQAFTTSSTGSKVDFRNRIRSMCFSVLYDLGLPESPSIIASHDHDRIRYNDFLGGSTTTRTVTPLESSYDIFLASDDRSTGVIEIFEFVPSIQASKTTCLTSKLQYTDRSDIRLVSSFDYTEEVPFDVDYFSHVSAVRHPTTVLAGKMYEFMAVANGKQGAKIYYWDVNANAFKFLQTLQPTNPDSENLEFADIQKIQIDDDNTSGLYTALFLISNKHIYNYKYTSNNNSFELKQTVDLKALIESNITEESTIHGVNALISEYGTASRLTLFIEEYLPRS